jgi:P27 family predicted phage terminase small subunit
MIPEPPKYLSKLATEEWIRLAPDLFGETPDRRHLQLFAAYCAEYALWREALAALEEGELVSTSPNGHVQVAPEVSIHNQSVDRMLKLGNALGLTPEARSKIVLSHKKQEEKDPWDLLKASRSKASKRLDA